MPTHQEIKAVWLMYPPFLKGCCVGNRVHKPSGFFMPVNYCSVVNKAKSHVTAANKKSDGIRLKDTISPELT